MEEFKVEIWRKDNINVRYQSLGQVEIQKIIDDIANKLKPNKLKTLKNHDSNTIRITPEHSIFNRGINLLKILVENYLSHSAVITKQLSKILSPDSQNSCINRCSALANIISAF